MAGTLSGGEQQMLAIGRALMCRPKVLMLDEPSVGLAPFLVQKIFKNIKEIHMRGTTVLLVEQNVRAAFSFSNESYVLENGQIVLEGKGKDLLENELVRKSYLAL
jgi:branched-chain amino acid transport system ATP-binding protein